VVGMAAIGGASDGDHDFLQVIRGVDQPRLAHCLYVNYLLKKREY
jgi:hypothetical protein